VRTLLMDWADQPTFVQLLSGGGFFLSGFYAYIPPNQVPGYPGLVYDTVDVEGLGVANVDPNGVVGYQWARLKITYRQVNYPVGANALTLNMQFGVDCRYVPNTTGAKILVFPDGTSPTVPIPFSICVAKISVTLYNCSQIPSANFQPVMGGTNYPKCVNSNAMTIKAVQSSGGSYGGALSCAVGTLLFDGVNTVTRIKNGTWNYDVTYAMSWRQIPWTCELVTDPSSANFATWQPLAWNAGNTTTPSQGNPLYNPVNFLPLLQAL